MTEPYSDRLVYSILSQTEVVSHEGFDDLVRRVESLSGAGLWAVETTDGLVFEACLAAGISPFYLLKALKSALGSTRQGVFFSGRYAMSRSQQHESVVAMTIETLIQNGADAFRIYDPMNDVRNLAHAAQVITENGKDCIGHLFHIPRFRTAREVALDVAARLVDMGCASIVLSLRTRGFFDPEGIVAPMSRPMLGFTEHLMDLREVVAEACGVPVGLELVPPLDVPPGFEGFRITDDFAAVALHVMAGLDA